MRKETIDAVKAVLKATMLEPVGELQLTQEMVENFDPWFRELATRVVEVVTNMEGRDK